MARNRVIRRSSGFGRGAPRRQTEWIPLAFGSDRLALAASSGVLTSSLNAAALAKRPFTVTRTVGSLFIASDQQAASEFPFGAFGMMVVSEKAVATGFTAVPDPVTEVGLDEWFVYQQFMVSGSGDAGFRNWMNFPFDSRAQRKVQDGEDITVMLANASATDGLFFQVFFRMLVKLA